MLKDKTIVVGVTGGIAAYKTIEVVSRLKKLGANVKVIMTEHALEFVGELSFRTLSLNPVYTHMFEPPKTYDVEHISLAEEADLFLIAPATANIIGKIRNGLADDLLSTTVMATLAPVFLAPSMNTNMYLNPLVKENMEKLESLGYYFIEPGTGLLACQTVGPGRMAEPVDIVEAIVEFFKREKDLLGKKLIVTAGPTVEEIDPVRYISNYSSGKMGYEIARAAEKRGADVVLISGPTNLEIPEGVKFIRVKSTIDMLEAIDSEFADCDILIKAAAPSDYRPKFKSDIKLKKGSDKENMILEFVENPDIAAYFGKKKGNRVVVGFAAETNDLVENARRKIKKKNLDFIVANDVTKKGAGFNQDTNIVSIIEANSLEDYPLMTKKELSDIIIDKILKIK